MQIDFHHAVTYVAARAAGFSHDEADIVAYCAQYVDDATNDGTVCFSTGAAYTRISSAHKTTDMENLDDISNHLVWLPFHFLPGNDSKGPGEDVDGTFIDKIVCRPNSRVARDMLDHTLAARDKKNALHRLGVSMHVYADTWAHQGFAGVLHDVNEVDDPEETGNSGVFPGSLAANLVKVFCEKVVPPLGHGRAQVFPDMPFLKWRYRNGRNQVIERDNTKEFCEAADAMCSFMQRFRGQPATGLMEEDKLQVRTLFETVKQVEGEKRHCAWLSAIGEGKFSFGAAAVSYDATGRKSWKARALGSAQDLPVHRYSADFLSSDWKLFHDAAQQHRLAMLHDILPEYGICAA